MRRLCTRRRWCRKSVGRPAFSTRSRVVHKRLYLLPLGIYEYPYVDGAVGGFLCAVAVLAVVVVVVVCDISNFT